MAAPLPLFRGGRNQDISLSHGMSSYASPGIVFNTNAEQAQASPTDPYGIVNGVDAQAGNVRPVVVPNLYYYLNLGVAATSGVPYASFPIAPVVRVYGLLPREQKQDRAYPQDANSAFPDIAGDSTGGNWWVPLLPEGGASGAGTTLLSGVDMVGLAGSTYLTTTATIPFYLAGTRRILVLVETAADYAASSSSQSSLGEGTFAAVIYGWFSG